MDPHPSSLSDQAAGLRHKAQPAREHRVLLPAALHALIAAIFARLFDRLEQLFQLWQSGDLPTAHQVQPATARQRLSARTPRHRGSRSKTIRRRARSAQESCARKPAPHPTAAPRRLCRYHAVG